MPIAVNDGLSIETLLNLGLLKIFVRIAIRFFNISCLGLPCRTVIDWRICFFLFFDWKVLDLIDFIDQAILSCQVYRLIEFPLIALFTVLGCCGGHCNATRNRSIQLLMLQVFFVEAYMLILRTFARKV